MTNFKVGDKVKVIKVVEDETGWVNGWVSPEMDDLIGIPLTIREILDTGIYFDELSQDGHPDTVDFGFPPSSLQLIEK